ncbi:hypothetical protein KAR91_35965 [Candidatus Pacearchaeota archaeon]|nr:hypothetical protein [Candidatus Pacearchaeota archaeon]
MSFTKQNYLKRLERALQDYAEFLQPDDRTTFLEQAVLLYSRERPLIKIAELTGDASAFDFSLPSGWVEDFSYIKGRIEYPVNDDIQSRPYVDDNSWEFIRKLDGSDTTTYIRFLTFTPASSEKARFEYTIPHSITESSVTVKDGDSEAVVSLAASMCFWALAARFAQTSDPSIEADVIDHQRKSELYRDLAEEKAKIYNALMGLGEAAKSSGAASAGIAVKDFDIMYPGSIGNYLTHSIYNR